MKLTPVDLRSEKTFVAEAQIVFPDTVLAAEFETRTVKTVGRKFSCMRPNMSTITTLSQQCHTPDEATAALKKMKDHMKPELASDTMVHVIVFRVYNVIVSEVASV